jgi:two-component system CheB/CheR fusion protein
MSSWNHEVIFAANGPEGVDRAREERPDVALIDIGLPGFDGYEIARRIRGQDSAWSRNVRLIALTG